MYKTEEYLEKYSVFEEWANLKYGEGGLWYLEENHRDRMTRKELRYFRTVRNFLTHNPYETPEPFILLTDAFKDRFDRLRSKLMDKITSVCVPYDAIYKCKMADKVMPTISVMRDKIYTYVPIMKGRTVWGVFCESTIFSMAGEGDMSKIKEITTFFDIRKYITEYSSDGIYDFVWSDATVDDVCKLFSDAIDQGRRLDVLYITNTGTSEGELVGLITIWDIATLQ